MNSLQKMRYRLGLDLGAKSIGWAMLRLSAENQPSAIIKAGVRIFPDGRNPKDGASLAVSRRTARQMRRRRDRFLRRKDRLMQALIGLGFFPADAEVRRSLVAHDPYALRKKGLDQALTPAEFARALFHINQRRGFKSNRKTDAKDNDSGALKTAIRRVHEQLAACGARSVGEWLAGRHEQRQGVRARLRGKSVKDKAYDLYIDRAMIEAEFDAIWAKQNSLNPGVFNEAARVCLKDILLFQRPLKPVEPGRCTLLPDERRAPLALPSVQRFRIYQEVNNLRLLGDDLRECALTLDQRDRLVALLDTGDLTFGAMRKALKLPGSTQFNLEDTKRDRLKGNASAMMLAKEKQFGARWPLLSTALQEEIVEKLLACESEAELVDWLQQETGVSESVAETIANSRLPEGYGNLSTVAISRVLPELEKAVVSYAEAVVRAGFESHSALSHGAQTGEIMPALPYYGEALQRHVAFGSGNPADPVEQRYGRIANPTVHIGLNEVRKVVNGLIKRYGHPAEIVVEVARELKQGKALRDEISKEQTKRQEENRLYRDKIRSLIGGAEPSTLDIQRMRLWVELNRDDVANRRCPYTGEQISIEMLYSDAVEIEHILPFSRTLDDSLNNKTVALRRANRDKANKTPFEAFGHSPDGYSYEAILERAKLMPRDKAKRFAPDAYQRWLKEDKDFLARALNDTAYISRLAKEYLTLVCPANKVRSIPGRLTALLRGKFGLNELLSGTAEKNRNDHRHHALDAAVIAITDQGLLQRFSQANAQAREKGLRRLVEDMPLPWPTYREQVGRALRNIVVSYRPDHGYQSGLHNDTAYGLLSDGKVVHRVPLEKFKSAKEIETTDFSDAAFKTWLLDQVDGLEGKEFASRIEHLTREHGTHRARVVEKLAVIPMHSSKAAARHGTEEDGSPRAYKGYKGDSNYCIEIWRNDKGTWEGTVVSSFEAHQVVRVQGWAGLRHPRRALNGQPLVMRLMIDDMLQIDLGEGWRTLRVATISGNGQIFMAEHHEANVDARNRDKASGFKYLSKYPGSLQSAKGRRVSVSPSGEMRVVRELEKTAS